MRYRALRRFSNMYERRFSEAWDDEEYAPKVRARRRNKNLPNAYDDYVRSDINNRNWKHYRSTQWRVRLKSTV